MLMSLIFFVKDGKWGYFLGVDLEYLERLHKSHNDYPLAPEKLIVNYEMRNVVKLL